LIAVVHHLAARARRQGWRQLCELPGGTLYDRVAVAARKRTCTVRLVRVPRRLRRPRSCHQDGRSQPCCTSTSLSFSFFLVTAHHSTVLLSVPVRRSPLSWSLLPTSFGRKRRRWRRRSPPRSLQHWSTRSSCITRTFGGWTHSKAWP